VSKPSRTSSPSRSRAEHEAEFGSVSDTRELARVFVVTSIIVPDTIGVRRKADGVAGTMTYQNRPRFYHSFRPSPV
jgi:hypothetical protein